MTRTRMTVAVAALALLLVGVLADAYAIAHHLPYSFGGHGHADRVAQEWRANGTALGPPLLPLVVMAVCTPLALAQRWWGAVADAVLALVAVAVLVGTFGEPSTSRVFEPGSFDLVQVLIRIATVAAGAILLGTSCLDLRQRVAGRRRTRRTPVAG